ncbi:MAG TPA: protein kinase [Thermoanaerobaculia bacterium]|nr:protein kinase [Thermoanaerobaculia bacterium]
MPGFRVGPYEVRKLIGAGGMGEVYKAVDTRLDRTVALKVLPSEFSEDAQMRIRFSREARAISSLRHPHICALYDVGETIDPASPGPAGSVPYLVMEYLEGETLDQVLRRGPLPIERVLRYGIEITDALEKAHRQQILHRDLKPSNIMITPQGASLLDFGLAKFLDGERRSVSSEVGIDSDTATAPKPLTGDGSVVGTLHYMAPEQLEGKEVDAHTDIFSFGVCLYEMVTGRRPFAGESRQALISAILYESPPPISASRDDLPASLDWVVRTCLAKDRQDRFQSAHDLKLELQRISQTERMPVRRASPHVRRGLQAALLSILVIAVLWATVWSVLRRGENVAPAGVRRYSVLLPAAAPIVDSEIEKLAVSPDGRLLVYVAEGNPPSLRLFSPEESRSVILPQTENARGPFFSPDGQWIGFHTADNIIKKISVTGGIPITIGRAPEDIRGAAWGPNDQIVFGGRWSTLKRISAQGGAAATVATPEPGTDLRWPAFLPDGQSLLVTINDFSGDPRNARLAVIDLSSGKKTIVFRGATYGRFVEPDLLLYFNSGTVYSVPFDRRSFQTTGPPTPLAHDVDSYDVQGLAHFALARDRTLFYIPRDRAAEDGELVLVDRAGGIRPLPPSPRAFQQPRLSPDGSLIVVTVNEAWNSDLWLYDIGRDAWTRLTNDARSEYAIWSPDGKRIVYSSNRAGSYNLFVLGVDGSEAPRQISVGRKWPFASSWSPDGRQLAVVEQGIDTMTDIAIADLEGGGSWRTFLATRFNEASPSFSPDGAWIAYQSDESGKNEVYVRRYPDGGRKWQISTDGGIGPAWSPGGEELFFRNGGQLLAAEITRGADLRAGRPRALFTNESLSSYDVAASGSTFLMLRHPTVRSQIQINVVLGIEAGRQVRSPLP